MKTISARNVNDAYPLGIMMLRELGVNQHSQYDEKLGVTLEMKEPVSLMYLNPTERVLFDPVRDANPFLHFFEALWIIAGRNDVAFLKNIVSTMANYSDNGVTFYGAYGMRLRTADLTNEQMHDESNMPAMCDQLDQAVTRLKKNKDDRQVVLSIRRSGDLWYYGKDTPCNLTVTLKIREGRLNMHVFNRSNDFVWGMTGANVVQFSTLHEYLAGLVGVPVGLYHQTTDSMHVYQNDQWAKVKNTSIVVDDPYSNGEVEPYPMMACDHDDWHADLQHFFGSYDYPEITSLHRTGTPYFKNVVWPMWMTFLSYKSYKADPTEEKRANLEFDVSAIAASDWRLAVRNWITRRVEKAK